MNMIVRGFSAFFYRRGRGDAEKNKSVIFSLFQQAFRASRYLAAPFMAW